MGEDARMGREGVRYKGRNRAMSRQEAERKTKKEDAIRCGGMLKSRRKNLYNWAHLLEAHRTRFC